MESVKGAVPGPSKSIRRGWGVLLRPTDPVWICSCQGLQSVQVRFNPVTLQSVLSVRAFVPVARCGVGFVVGDVIFFANARMGLSKSVNVAVAVLYVKRPAKRHPHQCLRACGVKCFFFSGAFALCLRGFLRSPWFAKRGPGGWILVTLPKGRVSMLVWGFGGGPLTPFGFLQCGLRLW